MEKTLPIVEIFKSIQGEGRYQGYPVTFVRTSGCNRKCSFCDTSYHIKNKLLPVSQIIRRIKKLGLKTVVWTGGEPLLFVEKIAEIKKEIPEYSFHLETNGDFIKCISLEYYATVSSQKLIRLSEIFNYICISPKELVTAREVAKISVYPGKFDIKVVTDFETFGVDMLPYATMLMPLSTYESEKDREVRQKVWNYCTEHNLLYSARLHVEVWGKTRKV